MSGDNTPAAGRPLNGALLRWDRHLWGVVFRSLAKGERPMLIGGLWRDEARHYTQFYPGEPTRPLLFTTRALAREWCREQNAKWRAAESRAFSFGRVYVVRAREMVRVVSS